MPASEIPSEDRATLATYWFAKLVSALDRADFILANEARDHLQRFGFDVRLSTARTPRRRAEV